MTEIEVNTDSVVKIGLPILTLLIFFTLLNISNSDVRIVDLTVADFLFAIFWIIIINIAIVGVIIALFFVITILLA